jgi:hypothetical protein
MGKMTRLFFAALIAAIVAFLIAASLPSIV